MRRLCEMLNVNRGWFDAAAVQPPNAEETALRDLIEEIVLEFPGYGYRRVTATLRREGWGVNHKRVLRIMREGSLLCQLQRRWVPTTDSRHGQERSPNLVKERAVTGLNQLWVADITSVRLPRAFASLAAILEAFSRKGMPSGPGWALSRWLDTTVALQALDQALATREIRPGLIHHADQGVAYASGADVERLRTHGIRVSMASVGNPDENAQAEAFFRTLKREEVDRKDDQTFEEAHADLAHVIGEISNAKRLHSALGDQPPDEFEETCGRANPIPVLVGGMGRGRLSTDPQDPREKKESNKERRERLLLRLTSAGRHTDLVKGVHPSW